MKLEHKMSREMIEDKMP